MTLTDEDIRAIVARAEALQRMGDHSGEAAALIHASEQLGISKSAMERAVRERLGTHLAPADGELVFARSADDKFYAATVQSSSHDGGYRVRFLKGGERVVAADELRECPFLPGDRVTCPWPGWGAWTGTVVSYDAENRALTISDGWAETAVFAVRDVWLAPRSAERQRRARIYAALLAGGAAVGAVIGALVTAMVM